MIRSFLHGFAQGPESWAAVASSNDHCVLLPGHGGAPGDVRSFAEVATDLAAQLPPQGHLIGYSMGGRLALAIALSNPDLVARLTLISSHPGIADDESRRRRVASDERLADDIVQRGIPWFVSHWENLPMWSSQQGLGPESLAEQRRIRAQHLPHGLSAVLRRLGPGVMPNMWPQLGSLPMPVDIIVGELDHKYAAIGKEMAELLPNAIVHEIAAAGHNLVLEAPSQLVAIIESSPARPVEATG